MHFDVVSTTSFPSETFLIVEAYFVIIVANCCVIHV
jgi:hypothetical protein